MDYLQELSPCWAPMPASGKQMGNGFMGDMGKLQGDQMKEEGRMRGNNCEALWL